MINITFRNGVEFWLPIDLEQQFLVMFVRNLLPMFATFDREGKVILCLNLHEILRWEIFEKVSVKPFKDKVEKLSKGNLVN